MRVYKPVAIETNSRHIAAKPSLGFEWEAHGSQLPTVEIGEVELVANESGIVSAELSTEQVGVSVLADDPGHLVAMVRDQLEADEEVVLTLNVTDEDDASTTAVARFAPPAWVNDQTFNFPEGYAADLATANGKKIKAINSVVSLAGGKRGGRILFLKLPALDTFAKVGCTTDDDFTTPARMAVAISCGSNPTKYVKRGRGEQNTLTITSKYVTFGDGLGRLNGRTATIMLLHRKEGLLVERLFMGNWTSRAKPTVPDGNEEVKLQSEGLYEYFVCLVAD